MSAVLRLGFVLALAVLAASQTDYCKICSDHTLCIYPGKSGSCKFTSDSVPLTAADKANIVDLHNQKRELVASGKETRGSNGGEPSASNMCALVWDDELATIAQRWADQCTFGHDACRDNKDGWVNQNVALFWGSASGSINWNSPVDMWYNEVDKFDKNGVDNFSFDSSTGHYTQVVWANTCKIGCGYSRYDGSNNYVNTLFVCNYGPGGNFGGQSIYKRGPPRTQCTSTAVNNAYPSLCVA